MVVFHCLEFVHMLKVLRANCWGFISPAVFHLCVFFLYVLFTNIRLQTYGFCHCHPQSSSEWSKQQLLIDIWIITPSQKAEVEKLNVCLTLLYHMLCTMFVLVLKHSGHCSSPSEEFLINMQLFHSSSFLLKKELQRKLLTVRCVGYSE